MRIDELLIESHNLEEGPIWDKTKAVAGQAANVAAQGVGAAAQGVGAVAGGVRGAWDRAKQGYKKGFNAVVGTPQGGQSDANQDPTAPAQQGGGQQAGGPDANQLRQQGQALIKQADQIEKQQKQAPAQTKPTAPAQTQQTPPAEDPNAPPAEDPNAPPVDANAQPADANAQQQAADTQPNQATAPAAPVGTTPTNQQQQQAPAGKLDTKAQNALKARLKAGQGAGAKTGSGFNQYVQGGGGQKLAGADAQGNPIFKQNVKREGFESRFLGMII